MDDVTTAFSESGKPKKQSHYKGAFVRLLKEKPLGTLGMAIVLICFSVGVFANFLAPHDTNKMHRGKFLKPPSSEFLLGTDNLGRDLLSRLIFGARVSMIVGVVGTAIATVVAVVIGMLSGFFGGKFDIILQRVVDAILCFPWIFMVLTIMAIVGQGLVQVIVVLGVLYGVRNSRIVRSAVIGVKGNAFVEAARALGCSHTRMLMRHIMPNILAPVIIIASVGIAFMIVTEATISFLGFGIPPPTPTWGGMITTGGRRYMVVAPWLAIWPGVALSIAVYGANVFGDAVRDVLDPRLRGGGGRYTMGEGMEAQPQGKAQ